MLMHEAGWGQSFNLDLILSQEHSFWYPCFRLVKETLFTQESERYVLWGYNILLHLHILHQTQQTMSRWNYGINTTQGQPVSYHLGQWGNLRGNQVKKKEMSLLLTVVTIHSVWWYLNSDAAWILGGITYEKIWSAVAAVNKHQEKGLLFVNSVFFDLMTQIKWNYLNYFFFSNTSHILEPLVSV